jgi:hypothetical protein
MNPKVIVIDGKTYHSVEEMPADVREKYEQAMRSLGDANNNQIPDVFETITSLPIKIRMASQMFWKTSRPVTPP